MVDCPRQHGVRQVLSCTPASHFALSPTHPELLVPRIPHSLLSSMVSAGMTEEWREAAISLVLIPLKGPECISFSGC